VSVLAAIAVGVAAGTTAGLMGIGGGILFVPALAIFLDKTQIEAEATSLLAIIPVAVVGAWRQAGYGNVRLSDGLWIGALSLVGAVAGAVVANALSQRALEIAFGILMLTVAFRLVLQAWRPQGEHEGSSPARQAPEPF
jgi:uncharacterized membrane protein YfcA